MTGATAQRSPNPAAVIANTLRFIKKPPWGFDCWVGLFNAESAMSSSGCGSIITPIPQSVRGDVYEQAFAWWPRDDRCDVRDLDHDNDSRRSARSRRSAAQA